MFARDIFKELKNWAEKPARKPLILRGARQTGKTTVVNAFAENFRQYIYLNLETAADKAFFTDPDDIHTLTQAIFLSKNKKFAERNNTLLFIDEIQEVPGAFNMLRYFYEEYPEIRVIAAGSLLETIFSRGLSFPVGRVEFIVIRPVSFPEFLGAIGEAIALEQLEKMPVNGFAHDRLLQLFHTYALIGGMPEVVKEYAIAKDLTSLSAIYEQLITAYIDDVEKYGKTNHLIQVIRHCIRVSFTEAGKRIKFQHFGRSDYSSREVGEALRTLEKTFLLSLLYPTISTTLPLLPDHKKSPRLHVLDTGIMNYFLGIQTEILGTNDLNKIHQGTIIEHLVGQELLAGQFNALSTLNFWIREKKTSMAEVDYVYPFEGQLIPIEVKSGKDGTLKSLHLFMDQTSHDIAIRFYNAGLHLTEVTTPAGKSFLLLSLPYFLASQTKKYIAWLKTEGRNYLSLLKKEGEQRPPTSPGH
jgi:predicted AAA+ superfamily ATPase